MWKKAYKITKKGIIAHPDAGKTTLTEKLLLFGGAIHVAGAVKSMSNLRIEKKDPKDIFVQDMIEFPGHYYFRLLYNQGYYIASVDKKTGKTLVEKCVMPGSIYELADANLQHGMQGTRSYRKFPVWGMFPYVLFYFVNQLSKDNTNWLKFRELRWINICSLDNFSVIGLKIIPLICVISR